MTESWEKARLDHRGRQATSIAESALSLVTEHGGATLTMAAIADRAEMSRQTLYRYYKDVDAVLLGVADLVTSHDQAFVEMVREQPDPRSQLELIAETATGDGHAGHDATALLAVLPPAGREIVAQHQARARNLLAEVLQRGIVQGNFRSDVDPHVDAPLILGLLDAAAPNAAERAITLVHRLVQPPSKGTRK